MTRCRIPLSNKRLGQPELDSMLIPVILSTQKLNEPLLGSTFQLIRLHNLIHKQLFLFLIKLNHLYRLRGNNSGPSGRHR